MTLGKADGLRYGISEALHKVASKSRQETYFRIITEDQSCLHPLTAHCMPGRFSVVMAYTYTFGHSVVQVRKQLSEFLFCSFLRAQEYVEGM